METVKVPATPGPKKQLCYQTPPLDGSRGNPMVHCDRAIDHGGRHTWEYDELAKIDAEQLKTLVADLEIAETASTSPAVGTARRLLETIRKVVHG
jgi:hypothetical protein